MPDYKNMTDFELIAVRANEEALRDQSWAELQAFERAKDGVRKAWGAACENLELIAAELRYREYAKQREQVSA